MSFSLPTVHMKGTYSAQTYEAEKLSERNFDISRF